MEPRVVRCIDNLLARIQTLEVNVEQLIKDNAVHRKVTRDMITTETKLLDYLSQQRPLFETLARNLEN